MKNLSNISILTAFTVFAIISISYYLNNYVIGLQDGKDIDKNFIYNIDGDLFGPNWLTFEEIETYGGRISTDFKKINGEIYYHVRDVEVNTFRSSFDVLVREADPNTFVVNKDVTYLAKDKNNVYGFDRHFKKIEILIACVDGVNCDQKRKLDPETFEVSFPYLIDKNGVYYLAYNPHSSIYLVLLNNADPNTFSSYFSAMYGSYGKDKNFVWFEDKILSDADAKSFKFTNDFASDNNDVFMEGLVVEDADPKSFKRMYEYFTDNKNIYFRGKKVNDVDMETFKDLKNFYAKDKNNVYYIGKILQNADPATFKVDEFYGYETNTARDKNYEYQYGKILRSITK